LVFGLWSLVFGLWSLVFGLWSLVFGPWSLVFGLWSLVFGLWSWSLVFGLGLGGFLMCALPCLSLVLVFQKTRSNIPFYSLFPDLDQIFLLQRYSYLESNGGLWAKLGPSGKILIRQK
jgi:hypothetical protein